MGKCCWHIFRGLPTGCHTCERGTAFEHSKAILEHIPRVPEGHAVVMLCISPTDAGMSAKKTH